jgi:hypothetical protein
MVQAVNRQGKLINTRNKYKEPGRLPNYLAQFSASSRCWIKTHPHTEHLFTRHRTIFFVWSPPTPSFLRARVARTRATAVLVRARGTVAAATTRTLGRSRASTSPSIPGRLGAGGEPAGAHVTAAFGLVSLLGRQAGVFVHDRYWEAGWTCDDWIREESDLVMYCLGILDCLRLWSCPQIKGSMD